MDNATIGAPTTLRLWHRFKASPDRVFQAWTRPDALRQWWCPDGWQPAEIDVDLRVGGRYRFAMSRPGEGRYVAVHGCFLDVQPGSRLVYTWQWDGAFTDMGETVSRPAVG
jgi:uncharacterized protein YndB with AHSA1/START domain